MTKSENISLEAYDDEWPLLFKEEAQYLMSILPEDCLLEFHHIGSTAIPDMPAKPIIDLGIMITCFEDAKLKIQPILQENGYEYIWREDRTPPFMTFIKRNDEGIRTHHVHLAEEEHNFWDRLYFREYLKQNRDEARKYFQLKDELCKKYPTDREAYTEGKSNYVKEVTAVAKDKVKEF
ncbi:MAG: GrpB family protein [Bacteriovoracaceae bacterium]|jgi:GrpB-like predicted nucleotidyltransferase (UPF0157 family)|nr:GrpB family protein [Bacteriovoracaceae bacterium]